MRITENELAALLQADRSGDRTACVDAESLALFAAGALEEPRRGEVLDHVATCSDCAEEVRLLPAPQVRATVVRPVFSRAAALALAASIVLPLLGLLLWQWMEIRQLHRTLDNAAVVTLPRHDTAPASPDLAPRVAALEAEVRELSQPQLNPAIIDLEPDYLRGGETSRTLSVPRGAEFFNVILTVNSDATFPDYALEIRDKAGSVLWRGNGLRRTEYGTFSAALPRRLLPAGHYELRVLGIRGGRETLLQTYAIEVRYP